MAIKNIDHFIDTTEHHIEQLINIATELEGSREVPGILYAVYYLTRSKEAAIEVKEKKDAEKSKTLTEEGSSGDTEPQPPKRDQTYKIVVKNPKPHRCELPSAQSGYFIAGDVAQCTVCNRGYILTSWVDEFYYRNAYGWTPIRWYHFEAKKALKRLTQTPKG